MTLSNQFAKVNKVVTGTAMAAAATGAILGAPTHHGPLSYRDGSLDGHGATWGSLPPKPADAGLKPMMSLEEGLLRGQNRQDRARGQDVVAHAERRFNEVCSPRQHPGQIPSHLITQDVGKHEWAATTLDAAMPKATAGETFVRQFCYPR